MVASLVQLPLFSELDASDLDALERTAHRERFKPGEVIFSQGDQGAKLYLIESGVVKIVVTHETGQHATLVLLHPGEFFGELSLLDGEPRSATATAQEPTVTLVVGQDDFSQFLNQRPSACLAVLRVLSRRLRRTNELVADASFLDIQRRLAKKLVELAETRGEEATPGVAVRLMNGYAEVAEIVGLDVDTTRRWLTRFVHRGLIKMERGRVVLLRLEALKQGNLGGASAESGSWGF